MARTDKRTAAAGIPLRLRRRRDGTLALVDADGRVGGEGRMFPAEHLFTNAWLLDSKAAEIDGDDLTIVLANARATYRVIERTDVGLLAEVTATELFDAAPVDEERAAKIGAEREGK